MTFGSLFAGIGGFDLGFERAGLRCRWQVDNNARCNDVLAQHWPDVKRYGDVRDVGNLEPVDVVCGGFPCQDVSIAGRRAGLAGERSGLWHDFRRVLEEIEPEWIVIENVPGLLSSNAGRDFATILSGLAELRYLSAWRVLDAQYFGLAQRRRRVFVVGHIGDGRAAQILFERDGSTGDIASREEAGQDATTNIASCLGSHHGRNDLDSMGSYVIQDEMAYNWQSGGDVRIGYGLPHLTTCQVPAVGVRRLTPTECERLQGFPDGWTVGCSDSARYRQLGNAVCVPVAEWIGRRLTNGQQ